MLNKKNFLLILFIFIFSSYFFGFISAIYGFYPYQQIKNTYKKILYASIFVKMDKCSIEEINNLPTKFSLIVGHAYGSPVKSKSDSFISNNLEKFLSNNINSINNLIFTGDVFSVPTTLKWNKLLNNYYPANIYVAPGNHDYQRLDSREIFNASNVHSKKFPFELLINENKLIIDNSVQSNWIVSDETINLINLNNSNIIIARHNIPIQELLPLANSKAGYIDLPNLKNFVQKFSNNNKITWVIGDGGAYANLPRISCFENLNHRFIVNGIGDVDNDTVLILYKSKIFKYILR